MVEKWIIADRPSWLARRLQNLNASEVAAVAGHDPYRTAFDIYTEKIRRQVTTVENAAMRRGRLFENAALEYYQEDHPGARILRPNVYIWEPEWRLGATPDALTEDEDGDLVNLQIKTISRPVFDRWDGAAPIGYHLQVCAENLLLDAKTGYLVVLVVDSYGAELEEFEVKRNPEIEARIVSLAAEFWDNVAAGKVPAPDYSRDGDTIKALNSHAFAGTVIDLSTDNRLPILLGDRAVLKAQVAAWELLIKEMDSEILDKVGTAERAVLPGWQITAKDEYHQAHMRAEFTSRPLRIKRIVEKAA